MNQEIKKIKLFVNHNKESEKIALKVTKKLEQKGFLVVEDNYDLAIAIGGDGAFLRMVKETNFNSNICYIGINTGTLGFLQEISKDDIDSFVTKLRNKNFKIEYISIQETTIKTKKETDWFLSLNEIVVRDKDLNTTMLNIKIDEVLLEKFVGDGILIATSTGTTAYNLSYGGSIIYPTLHTLELTPIAPLSSKAYRVLTNSVVIPESKVITLIPGKGKENLMLTVDGENKIYEGVSEIKTVVNQKRISCLRMKEYNFINIIQEKFLK